MKSLQEFISQFKNNIIMMLELPADDYKKYSALSCKVDKIVEAIYDNQLSTEFFETLFADANPIVRAKAATYSDIRKFDLKRSLAEYQSFLMQVTSKKLTAEKLNISQEQLGLLQMSYEYAAKRLKEEIDTMPILQSQSLELNNNSSNDDFSKYKRWWEDSSIHEVESNNTLFAAYQLMYLYNEVQNGGFEQFFNYAKEVQWNFDKMKLDFKRLLPSDFYKLFIRAMKAYKSGNEGQCIQFSDKINYKKLENEIMPQVAKNILPLIEKH